MKIDTNDTWEILKDAYRAAHKAAGGVWGYPESVTIDAVQVRFTMADHRGKQLTRQAMLATLDAHLGEFTLDEGDWSCATEQQRAAGIMLRDRIRLYINIH